MTQSNELIQKVAAFCWSKGFLDVFRKYFEDHGEKFVNAPEMCGGEHNMEYYSLFQDYLVIYENTLTEYLEGIDCTVEELYSEVREFQGDSTDPFLKTFIECLLASADYESFYKVMVKEGKKYTVKNSVKMNKRTEIADMKSEEKAFDRRVNPSHSSKYDDEDDDEGLESDYKNEGKYGSDSK
mmetsp:Transcript_4274/g.4438  ORF Transcript_4274/g.4438 Transcript_4274/m.4438 type:complete len:183 (+) Transcript_4274:139-687(+)|eukprot:CAMPEP_0119038592 /NCGR_PEP_ID=MMETSP1177-20130426/7594_1 /TAXON_ID=2985 /ORGANISM="Ochromonas sp, Strain CCMP1899" /LENGTH=182 /DNA_ID=CAMNT_0007001379 /DNA_START=137 /DNA_END=685 /DNA_ORIENTATION=-